MLFHKVLGESQSGHLARNTIVVSEYLPSLIRGRIVKILWNLSEFLVARLFSPGTTLYENVGATKKLPYQDFKLYINQRLEEVVPVAKIEFNLPGYKIMRHQTT